MMGYVGTFTSSICRNTICFPFGRPEIIASAIQLFLVNPIHFAVEQVIAAILGELAFTVMADRVHINVVIADIGNLAAIGRKLGIDTISEFEVICTAVPVSRL